MKTDTTHITTSDGARLTITIYEPAEATQPPRDIVLLHGWPNSGRVWEAFAERMERAAPFRLFAPTFRGFGDSDHPDDGYTCTRFAEDVIEILGELKLPRYALIGHSMGGKIAQLVAARGPERLAALALFCPVPLIASPVPEEKKATQRAIYGDAAKTRELLTGMSARPLSDEKLAPLVEDGLRASQKAWNGWIDPMREEDFTDELARIAVPTIVYHGAKDPLRTEQDMRSKVVERIPGAQLETLPHDGHLPHIEEPAALALLLVNFLDKVMG
jgi:pimeloyl-ACP methyl ester carboxylesterase